MGQGVRDLDSVTHHNVNGQAARRNHVGKRPSLDDAASKCSWHICSRAFSSAIHSTEPPAVIIDLMVLPPGPSTSSLVQTYRYVRDPLPLLDECAQQFGDIFALRLLGTNPWVFVSSPPLLKALFTAPPDIVHAGEANATVFGQLSGQASVFTMDESAHLDRRRLLLPQFHGDRMRVYFGLIHQIASGAVARWRPGVSFAMNRETQQMTLHAIIRAVFGIDTNSGQNAELVQALTDFANIAVASQLLLARPLQLDWGPWSPWGRIVRLRSRTDAAIFREIEARRRSNDAEGREDILSLLLQTRYEDGSPLTDQQIRDELVVMLMAGHETTATALAWAFERILSLPDVERRLREELDTIVGNSALSAAHLPQMEYLDAVVKESLGSGRSCRSAAQGSSNARSKSEEHDPARRHRRERHVPAASSTPICTRSRLSSGPNGSSESASSIRTRTPFGGGIRRCLGYAFALFEMKTILATILSQAQLRIERQTPRRYAAGSFWRRKADQA